VLSRERLISGCSVVKRKARLFIQAAVLSMERLGSGCTVVEGKVKFRLQCCQGKV